MDKSLLETVAFLFHSVLSVLLDLVSQEGIKPGMERNKTEPEVIEGVQRTRDNRNNALKSDMLQCARYFDSHFSHLLAVLSTCEFYKGSCCISLYKLLIFFPLLPVASSVY